MAILDDKRDTYVVRIVYDGPPFSGKTTTLRALSEGLPGEMSTPGEHDGRTLFFDWLDYTAGRFNGRPIRCQIVTVPGQKSLTERRHKLLSTADSVIFVADTGRLGMELSLKYARELSGVLGKMDRPQPGVVVQANKRDVEDALELHEVVAAFRNVGFDAAFIETTATSGTGVREAFLFGVRVALDRVRELHHRGLLRTGTPEVDSDDALLQQLRELDGDLDDVPPSEARDTKRAPSVDSPSARHNAAAGVGPTLIGEVVSEAVASETSYQSNVPAAAGDGKTDAVTLPDPTVPSGYIWPPVEGRVIIQQALAGRSPEIRRLSSGDLHAYSVNGWRFHSRARDSFADAGQGRLALVEWARLHARNREFLSRRRCLVLSPSGNRWRLWQIVGETRSLDEFMRFDADALSGRELAEYLMVAGRKLLKARANFSQASVRLSTHLHTIAADSAQASYVDVMPGFDSSATEAPSDEEPEADFLLAHLHKQLQRIAAGQSVTDVVAELEAIAHQRPDERPVTTVLSEILTSVRAA